MAVWDTEWGNPLTAAQALRLDPRLHSQLVCVATYQHLPGFAFHAPTPTTPFIFWLRLCGGEPICLS